MTVYILRYAAEGATSHVNEGFTNKADVRRRFNELHKNAHNYLKRMKQEYLDPLPEDFSSPIESYVRKVTVRNTNDLINLINSL